MQIVIQKRTAHLGQQIDKVVAPVAGIVGLRVQYVFHLGERRGRVDDERPDAAPQLISDHAEAPPVDRVAVAGCNQAKFKDKKREDIN